MKKLVLSIILLFGAATFIHSQTFVDFEDGTFGPLTIHVMGCGAWDDEGQHPVSETFMVIDNPDPTGINTSSKVMKFIRRGTDDGGMPWGGFWANCDPSADVSVNKYCHVKVWKPRISPLKFKLEGGPSGTLETASMYGQTITGKWEDIVFDFTSMEGAYPIIAFMPDFEDPLTAGTVQEIYFDEILFSDDPNPIGGPKPLVVDFEDGTAGALTLHVMGCGAWDDEGQHPVSETFMVIDNPDPSGINTSGKVMKFIRRGTDDGGWPWGGFWANCDPKNNVSGNQYCHVKVWKPRISPLKFKIEGGPSGTLETGSMYAQTLTGKWEDIVFDFTSMEGAYPVVAFMPDFEDPLTAGTVQEIFFDDIIFNNDPNPIGGPVPLMVDFEDGTTGALTLHVMGCGDWDNEAIHPVSETFMVVDNPDPGGINTSAKVMKFLRRGTDDGGWPWGGFWANCDPKNNIDGNKYCHVKVWKPRISPLKFKIEGGPSGTLETASMYAQTLTGKWEDIVFDFTSMEGAYSVVAFMPDFEDPLTAGTVQEIYFDDIMFNNDPNPIGGSVPLVVDFEDGTTGALTLHVMGCGEWDNDAIHPVSETFMVVDNPDPGGINKSAKVMKFIRRGTNDGGWPWGGFWANCDPKNNIDGNHYCHVKVWKPRISPLKFKIEGGPSGTLETVSMYAQTLTGVWEDIVFDFSSMDGEYPVVAFMPDFEDPLTAADVQEIYFDDIIFNNDPNPIVPTGEPLMVDFEDETAGALTLHVMGCGDWDNPDLYPVSETFMIVDNPDPRGINKSTKVMKFIRRGTFEGGLPWGGFWANCEPKNDITDNKYCHVKVWKSRISPLKFKVEGGPSGTLETASMYAQTLSNEWEDIVFDFTSMDGEYPIVAFMPDFEDPLNVGNMQEIYFDDIMFNNDPNPIKPTGAPLWIDFEDETAGPLTMHVMGCGDYDNPDLHEVSETFMIVDNPDPTGLNTSGKVMKFLRRGTYDNGLPWGGFWANCAPKADITGKNYVHVKVWKSRVSPLKFKLEGGPSGTMEILSLYPQTLSNQWEDIVFDFTTFTGEYPIVAFMPDFEDPLTVGNVQEIYFDDIIFSDNPLPFGTGIHDPGAIDITVYPNPCSNYLNLTNHIDLKRIEIYNVTGQVMISMENIPAGLTIINTTGLVNGVYVITIEDAKGNMGKSKLIKY